MAQGKKKPKQHRKSAAASSTVAPKPPVKPIVREHGGWWFDFTVDRDQLALLRFAFFAILAIDAFLQINHAPRYGTGFNVPHFGWLPLPVGRELVLGIDLALTYLFALAALGVATRVIVPLAAVVDAYYYFSSQLDSYQHHYLVVMLLAIASFVPWHARDQRVRSWALRLFCVQIAILYLWAAIAKLDPRWLDGTALEKQLTVAWVSRFLHKVPGGVATAAKLIILSELFLAAAWVAPRLWRYALPLGVGLHIGIELADFEIGQFSYLMFALYLLLLPRELAAAPVRALRRLPLREPTWPLAARTAAMAAALLAGTVLLALADIPVHPVVRIAVVAVGAIAFLLERARASVAARHLAAVALIAGLSAATDQAIDYYRFWGGSARRLGHPAEMLSAYEQLVRIDPDQPSANYYLGLDDLAKGAHERAIARFRRVQPAEPTSGRAWVGEARAWIALGDHAKARDALQGALRAEPESQEARDLLATLPP